MKHLLKQIDENTIQFQNSFAEITAEELNWKPNPDTWSIAQNINHLIIINESYYPILAFIYKAYSKLVKKLPYGPVLCLILSEFRPWHKAEDIWGPLLCSQ